MVDFRAHLVARTDDSLSPLREMRVSGNTAGATRVVERRKTFPHGGGFVEGLKARHFLLQTAALLLLFAVPVSASRFTEEQTKYFRQWLNERGYDADVNNLPLHSWERVAIDRYQKRDKIKRRVKKVQVISSASAGALMGVGGAMAALGATPFVRDPYFFHVVGMQLVAIAGLMMFIPVAAFVGYAHPEYYEGTKQQDIENLILQRVKEMKAARDQAAANGA